MCRIDKSTSLRRIDALIFFGTEEERSTNIVDLYYEKGLLPNSVLVIENEHRELGLAKYEGIEFLQSQVKEDLSTSLIPCLRDIDRYVNEKVTIGLDISAMPIPIFIQILHFLYKSFPVKEVIVFYTEPKHYNLESLFDFQVLHGEIDIKAIPGFEGKTAQQNEVQRVVFYILGFETNYLSKLIPRDLNPDSIIPINGFPSYYPKYKDISLINNNVNYREDDIKMEYVEANNPFETFNQLSVLQKRHLNSCVDIIPAGTKPMALGACLFALKNSDSGIRILFPFPQKYDNKNSFGNGPIWEYVLDK